MHLYFSLYGQQLCVSAQAFTIHAKVARLQIRRLSRRHLSFSPSKSVGIFFMIAHLITLIISSFTSSVGFPAERSLLRKARSAPRNSRASSGDSSAIRFSALRRNICSTSIVSADTHHSKCANENLPKSEYGSLLKGCRRSTNWNLCQCELNLIKFICYCVLSPCLLKTYSTIESLSIYIILKNPQRRGIRTLAYCV